MRAMTAPRKRFRLDGGGHTLSNKILELRLVAFIEERRSKKLRVTDKMICREAKRIAESLRDENPELKAEFTASDGFLEKFKFKTNLCIAVVLPWPRSLLMITE